MSRVGSVARVSKLAAAGAAASLALVAAAGCSSTPNATSTSTSTSTSTPTTGPVSAPQDAKITTCKVQNKIWLMNGTIHNSSSGKRVYTVVVDFDTEPGNKVITSRKVVTDKMDPGSTISFGASGANGATGISCKIGSVTSTP